MPRSQSERSFTNQGDRHVRFAGVLSTLVRRVIADRDVFL
jgi:hypothetical protein